MLIGVARRRVGVFAACAATMAMMACGLELVGIGDSAPSDDAGLEPDAPISPRDGGDPVIDASCEASPCVVDLSAGMSLTCVAIQGERPRCWGANDAGQLGSGYADGSLDLTPTTTPRQVAMGEPATAVSTGGYDEYGNRPYACAIGVSGDLWCWGDDTYGQRGRGDGGRMPSAVPERARVTAAREVHSGGQHACARSDNTGLLCWGRSLHGQTGILPGTSVEPHPVTMRAPIRAFSLGNYHSCALLEDGTVDCWGHNVYGQLGSDAGGYQSDAATIPNVIEASVVAAGHAHACAVHSGGKVSCWGYNVQGQVGREPRSYPMDPGPVAMPSGARAIDVCAGYIHSCALLEDRTMACWGNNVYGQLGVATPPETSTPVVVANVANVTRIACGGVHTCALHASGEVSCWGSNADGQLGRGGASGPGANPEAAAVVF